jgi:8-oxo-dGTP diphosphatase
MDGWYEWNEIDQDLMKFAVIIARFNGQFVIIKNRKRGGWEIPGGNREPGEAISDTARRELYEETGAIQFEIAPFGIYLWRGSYGMVFAAEIKEFASLPNYEIEEMKFVDSLPEGLNFGDMFYLFVEKWIAYTEQMQ